MENDDKFFLDFDWAVVKDGKPKSVIESVKGTWAFTGGTGKLFQGPGHVHDVGGRDRRSGEFRRRICRASGCPKEDYGSEAKLDSDLQEDSRQCPCGLPHPLHVLGHDHISDDGVVISPAHVFEDFLKGDYLGFREGSTERSRSQKARRDEAPSETSTAEKWATRQVAERARGPRIAPFCREIFKPTTGDELDEVSENAAPFPG
jgi:hypothetical protein